MSGVIRRRGRGFEQLIIIPGVTGPRHSGVFQMDRVRHLLPLVGQGDDADRFAEQKCLRGSGKSGRRHHSPAARHIQQHLLPAGWLKADISRLASWHLLEPIGPHWHSAVAGPGNQPFRLPAVRIVVVVDEEMIPHVRHRSEQLGADDRRQAAMRRRSVVVPMAAIGSERKEPDHGPDETCMRGGGRRSRHGGIQEGDLAADRNHLAAGIEQRPARQGFKIADHEVWLELPDHPSQSLQTVQDRRRRPQPFPERPSRIGVAVFDGIDQPCQMLVPGKSEIGGGSWSGRNDTDFMSPGLQKRHEDRGFPEMPLSLAVAAVNDPHSGVLPAIRVLPSACASVVQAAALDQIRPLA